LTDPGPPASPPWADFKALLGQPKDAVAIDRHEDREAQDDDRVDGSPDCGRRATRRGDDEVEHASEHLAQGRMERSGDVDRDALSVEPRLDVVHEGDWFAARPGRAAASCARPVSVGRSVPG
jgi:hypothetical protein